MCVPTGPRGPGGPCHHLTAPPAHPPCTTPRPPLQGFPSPAASPATARLLESVLQRGEELGAAQVEALLGARGADMAAVCAAADALRRRTCGDDVSYVVNRNINYTNVGARCLPLRQSCLAGAPAAMLRAARAASWLPRCWGGAAAAGVHLQLPLLRLQQGQAGRGGAARPALRGAPGGDQQVRLCCPAFPAAAHTAAWTGLPQERARVLPNLECCRAERCCCCCCGAGGLQRRGTGAPRRCACRAASTPTSQARGWGW
jgi:hypothetical protein